MALELKVEKKIEEKEVNDIIANDANSVTDEKIEQSLNYDLLSDAELGLT